MTTEMKLSVHLEYIVMPIGVPMNAVQIIELCDRATKDQRQAALDRARIHVPFILPAEERVAEQWVRGETNENTTG